MEEEPLLEEEVLYELWQLERLEWIDKQDVASLPKLLERNWVYEGRNEVRGWVRVSRKGKKVVKHLPPKC